MVYLIKRLIQIPVVVLVVVTVGFFLLKVAPGDPVALLAGEGATPEYLETIRKAYGLDRPLFEQYLMYMSVIFTGRWGFSLTF